MLQVREISHMTGMKVVILFEVALDSLLPLAPSRAVLQDMLAITPASSLTIIPHALIHFRLTRLARNPSAFSASRSHGGYSNSINRNKTN